MTNPHPPRLELCLTVFVVGLTSIWFTHCALKRPDTTVYVPPPPERYVRPTYDPEVHRLRNLNMCVQTRDELRAQCEQEQTLSACDRWVEATFICARYDVSTAGE